MIKKRLIFTLLVDEKQFQLSRNFSRQKVGDLDWLLNRYHVESIFRSIDELILINTSRDPETFNTFIELLATLSQQCFMPIAAGGGVRSFLQAKAIFGAGADKIILNSSLFSDQELVKEIAKVYGKQSIVGSVDYKINGGEREFYTECAQIKVNKSLEEVMEHLSDLPIGELYITSIDQDGTGRGYDLSMLEAIQNRLGIPIIASGGVGKFEHLYEGMQIDNVTGVSTANLFNFIGDGLQKAREYLCEQGVNMASWDFNQLEAEINEPA